MRGVAIAFALLLVGCGGGLRSFTSGRTGIDLGATCAGPGGESAAVPAPELPVVSRELEGAPIAAVTIAGAPTTRAAIAAVLETRVGGTLAAAALRRDLRRAIALGVVEAAAVRVDAGAGGATVTYQVRERPLVVGVAIDGAARVPEHRLRRLRGLLGTVHDPGRLERAVGRLVDELALDGYSGARARARVRRVRGGVGLCLSVAPGRRELIAKIELPGATAIPTAELAAAVGEPRGPNGVGGPYQPARLALDLATIEQRYADAGYLRVGVGPAVAEHTRAGVIVRIPVRENLRFVIGALAIDRGDGAVGPERLDDAALRAAVGLTVGAVASRRALLDAEARVAAAVAALDRGTAVFLQRDVDAERGVVDLVLQLRGDR